MDVSVASLLDLNLRDSHVEDNVRKRPFTTKIRPAHPRGAIRVGCKDTNKKRNDQKIGPLFSGSQSIKEAVDARCLLTTVFARNIIIIRKRPPKIAYGIHLPFSWILKYREKQEKQEKRFLSVFLVFICFSNKN